MTLDALLFQALNGLASASGLFFVGAGLSLIFGVTRIVNIAHGSLYMLGIYIAYSIATKVGGGLGFWGSLLAAPLVVAALGALIEIALLRRIYQAPELFQLLATFAVLLVINDATLWLWGPEDMLGPRAGLAEQLDDPLQRDADLGCHIRLIVALLVAAGLAREHDPFAGTVNLDAVRKAAGFRPFGRLQDTHEQVLPGFRDA